MENRWKENIDSFIELSSKHGVRMLMVGGGAVNFHGYQRHSADVDFWIETTEANFQKLIKVFNEMGYEINDFPKAVKDKQQNISVKFSMEELNLELITNFSVNKSFEQAYKEAEVAEINKHKIIRWRVLSMEDLITSKIKAGRPKDLLDIQELKKLKDLK
ncbi:nucleotidyltransferase [Galbibacter sp. EGI 63066]|uniref:nucleotidyl transferase AbiEii/AbiGii toxin family protein n=1 Tax=Galbibacter sp. EGI 63066 TaxID=2993559 RepID=UPI0022494D48|nr:nucleotidyl transferase AbiEii/AbiGii toxin family protein [Galbibacter sp. EGI 63066]MCX2681543.1 nucleotidyltransferase [Galbibacter sp. EGI 63066]